MSISLVTPPPQKAGAGLRMLEMGWIFGLIALHFLFASVGNAAEEKKVSPPPEVKKERTIIKPGDVLELVNEGDANFDGKYLVRENGRIIVPRTGAIPVADMELKEAETVVANAINKALKRAKTTIRMKNLGPAKNLPPGKKGILPIT